MERGDGAGGPRPARVLVVGDVHGEFGRLAEWSAAVRRRRGPLDAILAVGDAEANRDGTDAAGEHNPRAPGGIGDFPLVADGRIDLGAPLYFIGGNHDPWPALDEAGPGRWSGAAHFLGRAGVTDVAGFRVAFLSGIHAARVTGTPGAPRETPRDRTYYTAEELERVAREAREAGPVDMLLTHDWPSGVAGPRRGHVGRPELRTLCERVRPRWHFCGHMHYRRRAAVGPTRVVCLGRIRTGPAALALVERGPGGRPVLVEDAAGAGGAAR
ncbi:metallophosphoesterase [Streptomyces sp. DH37]|uniref:metallophosphoesterase family protein n=1 Tax=Streptomyces sp. DH37 TaxID=3040122 RepID=UPI0024416CA9|nr:metallophosphoesterase [Streptomyces sp. DH37]MDG9705375.1 metallophosphoesterase [Streptomyces sp. DH37]